MKPRFEGRTRRWARVVCTGLALMAPLAPVWAVEYVWLAPAASGGGAVARLGELEGPVETAASLSELKARVGSREAVARLEGEAVGVAGPADGADAAADVRLSGRRVLPEGALVYYQARLGRQDTRAVNDLELVPLAPGGNTFKLMWKGTAVSASQVMVQTSDGWRRVLKPAQDGTVSLATPFKGLYVLEVTARVNGSATVEGKKYEDVRHSATLSFVVE
ncbi:hypothetical protein WAE61_19110 [Comamonadaceae bacterium PP-2]